MLFSKQFTIFCVLSMYPLPVCLVPNYVYPFSVCMKPYLVPTLEGNLINRVTQLTKYFYSKQFLSYLSRSTHLEYSLSYG